MALIKAILPYFGGKRTLAPVIVQELGPHAAYFEPFCGSMAVLLAKEPSAMEVVNDRYGALINLAQVVQCSTSGPKLYRKLRRTLLHESTFDAACTNANDEALGPLEWAYQFFIFSWMGLHGFSGTQGYKNKTYRMRWTPTGGGAGSHWIKTVDSIPAWRRRMRAVQILNRDAFEVIERIDDSSGVAVYVDPPYIVKGATYIHDFEASDHDRLAAALSRFTKTRVVISYYEHPRLAELYPTWTKRNVYQTKAMVSQGQRGKTGEKAVAPEVLLINGPSLVEDAGLFGVST